MALVLQHPSLKSGKKKAKEDMPIEGSSFLMNAEYNSDMAQLTITMKNGGQYTYSSVDPSKFESFKQSRDKGRFYADQIKGVEKGSRTINKTIGPAVSKKTKT